MSSESQDQPKATATAVDKTKWWTLAVAAIATFMLMLDVTVVNIALPQLRASLNATFTDMQWVLDAYTLTLAAFLLTGGSLADRLGRKRVFLAGLAVFTLSSMAAGLASTIMTLNVARGVQGIGAAVLFAVAPALIGQEFRGKERGAALGIFGGVVGLALAIGPLVGGLVANGLGWRWIFLVNVPVGLGLSLLALGRLRESRDASAAGVDWSGMVLFGAALTLLVLGLLRAESAGWTSTPILSMLGGGLALLVAFFFVQRGKAGAGMLDLSLFRVGSFTAICLATLLSNATSLAAIFLEVTYLQNVLGYSPLGAGVRMLPLTIALFVLAAMTGPMVNRWSPGVLVGTSISLIAAGMGLMVLVGPDSSWVALLPSMLVMGIGMGVFNPPRAAVTIGVVEPAKGGMASGMGETFQQVGVAIGIAAFGAMFHHRVIDAFVHSTIGGQLGERASDVGRATIMGAGAAATEGMSAEVQGQVAEAARAAFVHGLTSVMLICAVVCAVGAVIAFAFIRRQDLHESALEPATEAPALGAPAAEPIA